MLEARVEKTVQDFLKKANVVTSDELKAVKKEVRELKKMISSEKEKSWIHIFKYGVGTFLRGADFLGVPWLCV